MMHSNLLYRGLLLTVFLAALWYSGLAGYRYYNYAHLTAQTRPANIDWQVREQADDDFVMEAFYSFNAGGKTFTGATSWPQEFYRNRQAAEQDKKYFAKQYLQVWYDPSRPTHSTLQKRIPFKECIIAAILWGLFLYFAWLGFYVSKFRI